MIMKNLKIVSLFAGVGGLDLGFTTAEHPKLKCKIVCATDFDDKCKKTYDLNFVSPKLFVQDILKVDIDKLPKFDILVGGFPCQPFSIAGYQKGFKDRASGGNLFFRIAEILEKRMPTAFLLENVKNLESHDKKKTFSIIEKTLTDLGYHLKHEVLNSMTHGNVPQNRERIFIVGFLDKAKAERFTFPEQIPLTRSFRDYVTEEAGDKYYYTKDKLIYDKLNSEINSEHTVYQWRRTYVRVNKKGVVPTLTANMGRGGHNVPLIKNSVGIRKLTPRECFSLQGFPDSPYYNLPEDLPDSELYHQAGNSVTVPVIKRIAEKMLGVL